MLVDEYGPRSAFLQQLAVAHVGSRRLTGVGIFVDLSLPRNAPRVDSINSELSAVCSASLAPPVDLVGFTLFIRGGVISLLEGYTYGDVAWPDGPMDEWLMLDAVNVPHQKAK